MECVLAGEYERTTDGVLGSMRSEDYEAVVELAKLPDRVRGYEELKLARVPSYREALGAAVSNLGAERS